MIIFGHRQKWSLEVCCFHYFTPIQLILISWSIVVFVVVVVFKLYYKKYLTHIHLSGNITHFGKVLIFVMIRFLVEVYRTLKVKFQGPHCDWKTFISLDLFSAVPNIISHTINDTTHTHTTLINTCFAYFLPSLLSLLICKIQTKISVF